MTVEYLDFPGLSHFKDKLDTAHAVAVQNAIQSALQQFSQDILTVVYTKSEIDTMLLNYYRNDGFGISSFGLSYFGGRG